MGNVCQLATFFFNSSIGLLAQAKLGLVMVGAGAISCEQLSLPSPSPPLSFPPPACGFGTFSMAVCGGFVGHADRLADRLINWRKSGADILWTCSIICTLPKLVNQGACPHC